MVGNILLGIIAFIVIAVSVPVHISISYSDKIYLTVRYLFVKFKVLPLGEKKPKKQKEKKPKEEKPKKEKPPKENKPNPILGMVKANGYDGMMEIIRNLGHIFALYGGKLLKSVKFNEIDIYVVVGKGDAAQTAIEYGKACRQIYPIVGFLCNNNVVAKHDISVEYDFLANKTQGEFYIDFHFVLRKIINSSIGLVCRLIPKVLLKFFIGAKKGKTADPSSDNVNEQPVK